MMENQKEKMENNMETGDIKWFTGISLSYLLEQVQYWGLNRRPPIYRNHHLEATLNPKP